MDPRGSNMEEDAIHDRSRLLYQRKDISEAPDVGEEPHSRDAQHLGGVDEDNIPYMEPLKPKTMPQDDQKNALTPQRRALNLLHAVIASTFCFVGLSVYDDSMSQWLYVRFEKEVLGENYTLATGNTSVSKDPCFHDKQSSPYKDDLNSAQSQASAFVSHAMVISLVPAVFTNILLGAYANCIGRRFIFILPVLGLLTNHGLTCCVAAWDLSLNLLYIGLAVMGITGGYGTLFMGLYLYTADNTDGNQSRSLAMVLVSSVASVFSSLSHMGVGYFISAEGYLWPMVTGLSLQVIVLAWFIFLVPETAQTKPFRQWGNLVEGVKGVFSFYLWRSESPYYTRTDFLLLMMVFVSVCGSLGTAFSTMYLMNEPLCWGSKKIGYYNTIKGLLSNMSSLALVGLLQRVFHDEVICCLSLISSAASKLIMAWATTDSLVYASNISGIISEPVMGICRAILSRMVSFEQRGSLFASIAAVEMATIAVSGVGLNSLYSATVALWRGSAYCVAAGLVLIATVCMIVFTVIQHKRRPKTAVTLVVNAEDSDKESLQNSGDEDDVQMLLP